MSKEVEFTTCNECGARAAVGAERCDLCGSPLGAVETVETPHESADAELPDQVHEDTGSEDVDRTCEACGRINRPDAIFCDQCATPVRAGVRATPPGSGKGVRAVDKAAATAHGTEKKKRSGNKRKKSSPAKRVSGSKSAEPKQRVGALLIGGVIVVALLYGITVMNTSSPPASPPPASAPSGQEAGADLSAYLPEDPDLAAQAEELRGAAEAAEDPAGRVALLSQLVELYASNGRLDLAGREQDVVASIDNSADQWAFAGNLHFDWMEQQSGNERIKSAQRAVESYKNALSLDPDNLDVRTDLGVAYLNDPASPMLAIRETNAVLEVNPDHLQANFNKGVMLIQIGRVDEAVGTFERVLTLAEPGTPAHDRAQEILSQIRSTSG